MSKKLNKREQYEQKIKQLFDKYLDPEILMKADYSNSEYRTCINDFKSAVQYELGLSFGNAYHANGIGNNNEYAIVLKEVDEDGFTIEKKVCTFFYVSGIYRGVEAKLTDNNGYVFARVGHAC